MLRVQIKIDELRLKEEEGMVKRTDTLKDPVLKNMKIHKIKTLTNFKLEPEQAGQIENLWEQKKKKL